MDAGVNSVHMGRGRRRRSLSARRRWRSTEKHPKERRGHGHDAQTPHIGRDAYGLDAGVPALVADGLMRRRDERFAGQTRYKALPDPLYDKAASGRASEIKFQPTDFIFDPQTNTCICPAGKKLYSSGSACTVNGRRHHKFKGTKRDCVPCTMRDRCLRHPERTAIRQVAFFDKIQRSPLRYTERMKRA